MEQNKVNILIFSGVGLFLILIIWAFISAGGNSSDDLETVNLNNNTDSNFTIDDMTKVQDNKVFNESTIDPFAKETESIDNLIASQNQDSTKGFYDNEEDPLIAELQKEYEKNQNYTSSSNYSMNHKKNDKPREIIKYVKVEYSKKETETTITKSNEIELDDFEFTISDDDDNNGNILRNDIPAVIDENYKGAKANQIIRIRTTKDCIISGAFIPENTIIEGITSFGNRRVFIDIEGVDLGNSFITCSMEVRDRLKRKGLESRKNLSQELKKEGSEELADGGNAKINTPIGSFGVNALKRNNREQKIDLHENHKLYLRLKTR